MKPDFSGEFVLDRPACTLSPGADGITSAIVRIEHREPVFRYAASFVAGATTMAYSFELIADGPAASIAGDDVSRLYWEGDALVTDQRDPNMTMSWRYELIDDGRRLRATERIRGSHSQDNVWEFARR